MTSISLRGTGLLEAGRFLALRKKSFQELRSAVASGFRSEGPKTAKAVQANVQQRLRIRNRGFLSSYRFTLYASRPDRLPAMAIGSRVRFSGMLEHGGTVLPKGRLLLIPFGNVRIGAKRFHELVAALMRSGNAYFRTVNGRAILFAENIGENDKQLGRFKRVARRSAGVKRLKRGADVPIAVGIPQAQLQKKTDVVGTVTRRLRYIAQSIEHEIARNASGR